MRNSAPESYLQHPLTGLLGQGGNVRVMRALIDYGGPLSVTQLVRDTGLSAPGVRAVLGSLAEQQIVIPLGRGKAQLFELRRQHPLMPALNQLFADEKARWEAIVSALRSVFESERRVASAWYYGSVARREDAPRSDLDVAIAIRGEDVETVLGRLRDALQPAENTLLFTASLLGLSEADIARISADGGDVWWRELVGDAKVLVGERPEAFAAKVRRQLSAA
jgi:predicted nucleotidyltransferase